MSFPLEGAPREDKALRWCPVEKHALYLSGHCYVLSIECWQGHHCHTQHSTLSCLIAPRLGGEMGAKHCPFWSAWTTR